MNYDEMIKVMKAEHKKFTEVGRQFRALKRSTTAYIDRALDAACQEGLIDTCYKWWRIPTKVTGISYNILSSETGVSLYPAYASTSLRTTYSLPSGNIETVLTRLRKMDDPVLEDKLRCLYKFLKEYSE